MPIRRALITALLPLLAATAAQAQQGAANVETQRFQDWEVGCPTGDAQQGCTMSQMVNNPDSNEPLMRAMVGYPPQAQGNAVIAFMVPLGVNLAPGMQLQVDDNEPVGFPYQFCQEQGCRADLPLEPSMLQQLRSGTSATVSAIAPDGQRLDLDLSLMGFTSASQEIAP